MKTIFLFLGNRLNITDTLHTRFIKELSRKYRVVVFFPTEIGGIQMNTSTYPKLKNVYYHLIPAPAGRFWCYFSELRSEFITRFNNTGIVKWQRKREKYSQSRRLFKFIAKLFPTRFFSSELFTKIESIFVPGYGNFKEFARSYTPDLVLVPLPNIIPLETYAILWARRAGIPTVAYNPTWDNLLVYPRHIRKTDYISVWNEQSKEVAIDWHGYSLDKVFVGGILRFDHYFRDELLPLSREEFLKSKGLDPRRKTVFFASRSQGTSFSKDFIHSFISWQKKGGFKEPVNLFVRAHIIDSMEDYQEFIGMSGVHIERAGTTKQIDRSSGQKSEMDEDALVETKMTLKYCDVCINITSTMSAEAMVFDMPVVSAGFVPMYSELLALEHISPLVEHGAIRVASSMDEIHDYIKMYLENPAIDRENRKWAVPHALGPTDGYSYKRIVNFVDEILEKESR